MVAHVFSTDYLIITQFITHLTDGYLGCFQVLAVIATLYYYVNIYVQFFCVDIKFCAYLSKYQGVQLLEHTVKVFWCLLRKVFDPFLSWVAFVALVRL